MLAFSYSLEWLGRDAFVDEFYLLPGISRARLGTQDHGISSKTLPGRSTSRALHLEVVRQNAAALQVYRKLGFEGS